MKKIDLGQTIQIVANVGVVVGIGFLALEMRLNRELLRAEIHQSRADTYISNRQAVADSEFLLPVLVKLGTTNTIFDPATVAGLDEIERARLFRYFQALYADYDNQHYQYRLGFLDESYYQSRVVRSLETLAPIWVEFGITNQGTPEFQAEIERILSAE